MLTYAVRLSDGRYGPESKSTAEAGVWGKGQAAATQRKAQLRDHLPARTSSGTVSLPARVHVPPLRRILHV